MVTYDTSELIAADIYKIAKIPERDQYFIVWLWFYFRAAGFVDHESSSNISMLSVIESSGCKDDVRYAVNYYKNNSISKNFFRWISRDERQIKWLMHYIANNFGGRSPGEKTTDQGVSHIEIELRYIIEVPNIDLLDRIRLYCDFNDESQAKNVEFLQAMEGAWLRHKVRDKEFKWFSGSGSAEKRAELFDWLKRNMPFQVAFVKPFDSYSDVLCFFDSIDLDESSTRRIIENVKANVYQKQYRNRLTSKTQKNFVLSNSTIRRLELLKERHGISQTQIVETLIRKELERGVYIAEEISLLRGLDAKNHNYDF